VKAIADEINKAFDTDPSVTVGKFLFETGITEEKLLAMRKDLNLSDERIIPVLNALRDLEKGIIK